MPFAWALGLAALVSAVARKFKALSTSGAVAATAVGIAILWATGWGGGLVLGVYFVSSTGLSRMTTRLSDDSDQTTTEVRTARQVLANGGWAALGALADWRAPGQGLWLVTVSLAASPWQ